MNILLEKKYEESNLIAISGKYNLNSFNQLVQDTLRIFKPYSKYSQEYIITTTKSLEVVNNEQIIDVEILFPISHRIQVQEPYIFKEQIRITNALYLKLDDIAKLQDAMNKINQYVIEKKLQPITSAYLVQSMEEGKPAIEIYMGISPNVL